MKNLFLALTAVIFVCCPVFASQGSETVDTIWTRFWDGAGSGDDEARAVCVSHAGAIYVTGIVRSTSGDFDIALIKYNIYGDTLWVRSYAGDHGTYDEPTKVAVDKFGNVYVSGWGGSGNLNADGLLTKYSNSGDLLWTRAFGSPFTNDDWLADIDFDSVGNVAYVGTFGQSSSNDIIIGLMSPDGDTLWTSTYSGPGIHKDLPAALEIDQNGNVLAAGTTFSPATNDDIVCIKLNPDGDTSWVRVFNYFGTSSDHAVELCVDSSGAAYVVGLGTEFSGGGEDCLIIKYSSAGVLQWVRSYGFETGFYDYPADAVFDDQYNLLITGRSHSSFTSDDIFVLKLNPDGDSLWCRRYSSVPNGGGDHGDAIAVDHEGNIYVGGGTDAASLVLKLNQYGDRLFVSRGTGSSYNMVYDIAQFGDTVCTVGRYDNLDPDLVTSVLISFVAGDPDGNGIVTISDAVFLINYIFAGGPAPNPLLSGDADCNGIVTISDAVYLINYIFAAGPPPCDP